MLGIFLDAETNGLNPFRHVVLEIAFIIKDLVSGEVVEKFVAPLLHPKSTWEQSDPASLQVNGLSPEKLGSGKGPEVVGREIVEIFERLKIRRGSALFICQNPSFDRAFFSQLVSPDIQEKKSWPYHWLDLASMFFALRLKEGHVPWDRGLSKDAIAAALKLDPEASPHRALQGVEHLMTCYEALIEL